MSDIPTWCKDDESMEIVKEYLKSTNIIYFFEIITENVLRSKPDNVYRFCLDIIQDLKDKIQATDGKDNAKLNEPSFKTQSDIKETYAFNRVEDHAYLQRIMLPTIIDDWILALIEKKPDNTNELELINFHYEYIKTLCNDSDKENENAENVENKESKD